MYFTTIPQRNIRTQTTCHDSTARCGKNSKFCFNISWIFISTNSPGNSAISHHVGLSFSCRATSRKRALRMLLSRGRTQPSINPRRRWQQINELAIWEAASTRRLLECTCFSRTFVNPVGSTRGHFRSIHWSLDLLCLRSEGLTHFAPDVSVKRTSINISGHWTVLIWDKSTETITAYSLLVLFIH